MPNVSQPGLRMTSVHNAQEGEKSEATMHVRGEQRLAPAIVSDNSHPNGSSDNGSIQSMCLSVKALMTSMIISMLKSTTCSSQRGFRYLHTHMYMMHCIISSVHFFPKHDQQIYFRLITRHATLSRFLCQAAASLDQLAIPYCSDTITSLSSLLLDPIICLD